MINHRRSILIFALSMILLVPCVIILIRPGVVSAANHYIRKGATGANDGSDWTNAWQDLPTSFTRGDTYYVADGTYGSHIFTDPESGTSFIYIKKATVSDHGTDTGWQDAYGDGRAIFAGGFRFQNGYYEINGQTRVDWDRGYGFKIDSFNSRGVAADSSDIDNIVIKYCEIEGPGMGLNSNCSSSIYFPHGDHDNIYVGYSWMHDIRGAIIMTGGTNNTIIEFNLLERNGSDAACHGEAIAPNADDNLTIRHNRFRDTMGSGVIFALTRGGTIRQLCENWEVYGNTFYRTPGNDRGDIDHGILVAANGQVAKNWKFYNNTIVNLYDGAHSLKSMVSLTDELSNYSGTEIHQNVWVRNNLWYNSFGGGLYCENSSYCAGSIISSHNYYRGQLGSHFSDDSNEESYSGLDSSIFDDMNGGDFHLTAATAPGYITTLNSKDPDNTIRGSDGTWDRGAFEYNEGSKYDTIPPKAPTSLSVF